MKKKKPLNQIIYLLAIAEIRRTASEENAVSVSDLSRNTGLSKGFFYKNEQVRNILNEEKNRIREHLPRLRERCEIKVWRSR